MNHTHIVQPNDLSHYADTRESQGVIPELVYHLVRQSVPDATECRIPYGDAVNQPGCDGFVESDTGYLPFVPVGISYWEIGTGSDPQKKATADFEKRTQEISDAERAKVSFIFVTPRSLAPKGWQESQQREWIERRKDRGWKKIQIIDGGKLADWLREFPALGCWMATKTGITRSLGGITTPLEHWNTILFRRTGGDPPLPPELFTVSRSVACDALDALFSGSTQKLFLLAESEQDVDDFVAAYLSTLEASKANKFANRCLFISDANAWHSVSILRKAHILVASPRLGLDTGQNNLQAVAAGGGHRVIIPLCGAWAGGNPEIIKLISPSQSQIEDVLKKANFPDIRARELGRIGGGRISAFMRHLSGMGTLPPYATWGTARQIAQAGLVGKWYGKNTRDIATIEELLGKGYGEWIETLRTDTLRSDSPLIQTDEMWRFVSRGEAWSALGKHITDDDLDHLKATAISILEERDPQFDLPKDERFMANARGKELGHSDLIRNGITETLALIGSRSEALSFCSHNKAEDTAILAVRSLLNEASWDRWASLNSHLPLLAEAAPDEFLAAVESATNDLPNSPFHEIFAQEGGGGLGGTTYISGLLWALEGLAWNPDYLVRVSVILADIASIDPGGGYSNRPARSLADIFLPWYVQTMAPFAKRETAIKTVIHEQPEVGYQLLLALLPRIHSHTSGCHQPIWRKYIPQNWKNTMSRSEYWEQITAFTDLAVEHAQKDTEKLGKLIDRLSDLPSSAHEKLLDYLSSDAIVDLPESKRLPLWEKLENIVRRHRKYSDAGWALPEETVQKIKDTSNKITPSMPKLKYRQLFSNRGSNLFDKKVGKVDYKEQRRRLDEARQAAITTILGGGDLDSVLQFAVSVTAPYEVGRALGVIASNQVEDAILRLLLVDSEVNVASQVIVGFISTRFLKLKFDWVDEVLGKNWSIEEKAVFLKSLPCEKEVWQRVSSHLGDEHENLYWRDAQVNPYNPDYDFAIAIEKLIEHKRAGSAVMCLASVADNKSLFDETLATRALLEVIQGESGFNELDNYQTVELIKHLQASSTTDQDALFQIEWNFLLWLDEFSSGSPITLEKRLASNPSFFADAIGIVFRSTNSDVEESKEPTEQKRNLVKNTYILLTNWKICPGTCEDNTFDATAFNAWINEARKITEETGHTAVAQMQIGHVLTHAPSDPNGLWIHESVATVLDSRNTDDMRSGYTTELFNQRGAYLQTEGQEERELAQHNREKADSLEEKRYSRFATAMREFANMYDREAEREPRRYLHADY